MNIWEGRCICFPECLWTNSCLGCTTSLPHVDGKTVSEHILRRFKTSVIQTPKKDVGARRFDILDTFAYVCKTRQDVMFVYIQTQTWIFWNKTATFTYNVQTNVLSQQNKGNGSWIDSFPTGNAFLITTDLTIESMSESGLAVFYAKYFYAKHVERFWAESQNICFCILCHQKHFWKWAEKTNTASPAVFCHSLKDANFGKTAVCQLVKTSKKKLEHLKSFFIWNIISCCWRAGYPIYIGNDWH